VTLRHVPADGRGHARRGVYCSACPTFGVPGGGWFYEDGYQSAGRVYTCPSCGPAMAAYDAARAAEPLDDDPAAADVRIDARARALSRAGIIGGGGR
jgi:hypothetical protein